MEQAAAPSVIARIAHVGPADMRKCFSRGSIVELDIISSVVPVIRKIERGGEKWNEQRVWLG